MEILNVSLVNNELTFEFIQDETICQETFSDNSEYGKTLFFNYKTHELVRLSPELQSKFSNIKKKGSEVAVIPDYGVGYSTGVFEYC